MKNTFNILYYTGISIMLGFVLIISLFAMNIQNILITFAKDRPQVNPYVKDSSAFVIQPKKEDKISVPVTKPVVKESKKIQSVAEEILVESVKLDTTNKTSGLPTQAIPPDTTK